MKKINSLINRSATRSFILNKCATMRPHLGLTQVSSDVYEQLEAKMRAFLIEEIKRHPSVGKTFRLD